MKLEAQHQTNALFFRFCFGPVKYEKQIKFYIMLLFEENVLSVLKRETRGIDFGIIKSRTVNDHFIIILNSR